MIFHLLHEKIKKKFGHAYPEEGKHWLIGKDPDTGKDWRQKERRVAEDEMVR